MNTEGSGYLYNLTWCVWVVAGLAVLPIILSALLWLTRLAHTFERVGKAFPGSLGTWDCGASTSTLKTLATAEVIRRQCTQDFHFFPSNHQYLALFYVFKLFEFISDAYKKENKLIELTF